MIRSGLVFGALLGAAISVSPAFADIITFDNLKGPSSTPPATAGDVTVSTSIGNVKFSGGAILTKTTYLPADQTSVYYDSYFLLGTHANTMTITFPKPVTNFLMYLYNGWTAPDTFTISDNTGHSVTASNVPSNFSSGVVPILFGSVGTVVSITTTNPHYDFVIDNVQFNQGTTPGVPETSTWAMMLLGFAGSGFAAYRRGKAGIAPAAG